MRNALVIDEKYILTMDNAAAIGERKDDVVQVSDELTAYYTMRVALLEQWGAWAMPCAIMMGNFSGGNVWPTYEKGIQRVFTEVGIAMPPLQGSSETNMLTLQSGINLTVLGKKITCTQPPANELIWYIYGLPLVGSEVVRQQNAVARLDKIYQAWQNEIIVRIWPVGSKGILAEVQHLFEKSIKMQSSVDLYKTAGPATAVLIACTAANEEKLQAFFRAPLERLDIIGI